MSRRSTHGARWMVAALASTALLAGCGGGESAGTEPTRTTTAAPETYTEDQLRAALPTVKDVPGGSRIELRCPQDEDRCGGSADRRSWSVLVRVDSATPVMAEMAADAAVDYVAVNATLHSSARGATAALDRRRKDDEVYAGAYDTPDEKVEQGYIPGERGTGSVDDAELGGFAGYRVNRIIESEPDSALRADIQSSQIVLVSGPVVVTVQVKLAAPDREDDAAAELAQTAVEGYLQRLDR